MALGAVVGSTAAWAGAPGPTRPVASEPPATSSRALEQLPPVAPGDGELTPTARADRGKRSTPMTSEVAAAQLARAWAGEVGAPPSVATLSVLWAHWALETGRGQWMRDHNFAGIKGVAPDGGSALWWTSERIDGAWQRMRLRFRAYAAPEDGASDYVRLLRRRFPPAFTAATAGDVRQFARELSRATYFTSDGQDYERSLASLSREFRESSLAHRDFVAAHPR